MGFVAELVIVDGTRQLPGKGRKGSLEQIQFGPTANLLDSILRSKNSLPSPSCLLIGTFTGSTVVASSETTLQPRVTTHVIAKSTKVFHSSIQSLSPRRVFFYVFRLKKTTIFLGCIHCGTLNSREQSVYIRQPHLIK